MVRKYKKKTDKTRWFEDAIKRALDIIKAKRRSLRAASSLYCILRTTLQRRLKEKVLHPCSARLGCFTTAFPPDAEDELVDYIKNRQWRFLK